jgi:hypothetical protein
MPHRTSPRPRNGRAVLLAVASLAVVLTAAPPAAAQQIRQQGGAALDEDQVLAFAQCMRENGYAEFPDPEPDGGLRIRVDPSSAPRFQAAQEACRDLSPISEPPGPPSPEQIELLVGLAQCLRDNGLADFPDPNPQGAFSIGGLGVDPGSAQWQAAFQSCVQDNADFQSVPIAIAP